MSKTTTNLGLIKPELSDPADITALNENWDKIDTLLVPEFGTEDLTAGESALQTGKLYFVYE